MRIAYIITRADSVGGASIHVRDVAAGMQALGHQVIVLIGGGAGTVTAQLEAAGVPFQAIPSLGRPLAPLRDLAAYHELRRALAAWKPDLVSAHTSKAGWLGRAAARSLNLPAIYTPHGWTITDRLGKLQGRIYTMAERIAAPWCKAIVCVSHSEKILAIQHSVGRPDQLHVIHNGVRDVAETLRANAEAADAPCRLISVARFEAPKDHHTLLVALSQVDSPWTLDLVGDGPLEPAIRALAESLGVASRIRFRGYQEDPAALLAESHVFILSTRSEGFPRSILEAMRAGLPVIASNVGGIAESVADGVSGKLVPPEDVVALTSAIADLAQNPPARQRMGDRGHHIYSNRFRLEHMLDATAELYRRTLL